LFHAHPTHCYAAAGINNIVLVLHAAGRWLGIRLDFIGNLSVCFAAAFVALRVCISPIYPTFALQKCLTYVFLAKRGEMDPGYGALAITCQCIKHIYSFVPVTSVHCML
jgi:hypothetical protein